MKRVLYTCILVLLFVSGLYGSPIYQDGVSEQEQKNKKTITADDVIDIALCMQEGVCKGASVLYNAELGPMRSGYILKHKTDDAVYTYVLTAKKTFMVMIETSDGQFLLDDVFLSGLVTSGFFLSHNQTENKQYPEKIKQADGTYKLSVKEHSFFQSKYNEAMLLAVECFVDKRLVRKHRKPDLKRFI
jgi:hypothetical protein